MSAAVAFEQRWANGNNVKKKVIFFIYYSTELYLHDLSLYFPISFNSDVCKYDYNLDKYFEDNYAYFIKSNDNILGFVLVDDNKNGNYEIYFNS